MIMDVAGIRFSYSSKEAISGMHLSADTGEIVSILGPNGAGKTTLLKCMNRIHEPEDGCVNVDGEDILSIGRRDVARLVGYVPQRAHVSGSTVFESVLIGRKPHIGMDASDADIRLTGRVIDMMGLSGIAERSVSEISGGEYQLVQIARAVVQQPRVILLDEPTSNLDLSNQHRVMRTVSGIVKANGMTAVMTNHDINLALRYSDRFVLMRGGTVYAAGGREVVTPGAIRDVYGIDVEMGEVGGVPVIVPRM